MTESVDNMAPAKRSAKNRVSKTIPKSTTKRSPKSNAKDTSSSTTTKTTASIGTQTDIIATVFNPTVGDSHLHSLRSTRHKYDENRQAYLQKILDIKGEGISSRQRSVRDQQRLWDVTAAAKFFSGGNPVQKDVNAYCGYSSEASQDIRFLVEETRSFDNWYAINGDVNEKQKRIRGPNKEKPYDTRHGWSEDEVREMAYATFADQPDMISMLDEGWVPKHWV